MTNIITPIPTTWGCNVISGINLILLEDINLDLGQGVVHTQLLANDGVGLEEEINLCKANSGGMESK